MNPRLTALLVILASTVYVAHCQNATNTTTAAASVTTTTKAAAVVTTTPAPGEKEATVG